MRITIHLKFPALILCLALCLIMSGCLRDSQNYNLATDLPAVIGTFYSEDKVLKIVIPENAWPAMVGPEITEVTAPTAFPTATITPVGKTYKVGPETVSPTGTLTVTLKYDQLILTNGGLNENVLKVYTLINNIWTPVSNVVLDQVNDQIVFTTTTVGSFRIGCDSSLLSLAVALTAPSTDPNIGAGTGLLWTVPDATAAANSHTYQVGVFTADTDSALIQTISQSNLTSATWSISRVSNSALVYGNTYYWGVRYIAADGTAGPWTRKSFIYTPGPVIVDSMAPVCNLTGTSMTVIWRTESTTANNRVYYAFDGAVPTVTGTFQTEDATLSTATRHLANLSWVGETHSSVSFFIYCENSAAPAISTVLNSNGANFLVQVGEDSTPPPAPEVIFARLGTAADGDLVQFQLKRADGSLSFPFIAKVSSGSVNLNHLGTRWNLSSSSPLISEQIDTLKITGVKVYGSTSYTTYQGETSMTNVAGIFTADNNIDTSTP